MASKKSLKKTVRLEQVAVYYFTHPNLSENHSSQINQLFRKIDARVKLALIDKEISKKEILTFVAEKKKNILSLFSN